jgi:hypothetical protein
MSAHVLAMWLLANAGKKPRAADNPLRQDVESWENASLAHVNSAWEAELEADLDNLLDAIGLPQPRGY